MTTTKKLAAALAMAILLAAAPMTEQRNDTAEQIADRYDSASVAAATGNRLRDTRNGDYVPPVFVAELPVAEAAEASQSFVGPVYEPGAQADLTSTNPVDAESNEGPADSLAEAARSKMSGPVAALAAAGGPEPAEIIVSYADYPELFEGDRIESLGGQVVRRYENFDMLAISIPAESLVELAIEDTVDRLSLDDAVRSMGAEMGTANVPVAGSANAPYSGSSIGVAIIDTGISNHSDLADGALQYKFLNGAFPTPTITNGEVASENDDPRKDLYGHGTHVAGIVAGNGTDSDNEHKGSAIGSNLLALQVLDNHGQGTTSDVIAALDWLAQYGSYFDIRVVNLSLGQGVTESIDTDPMVLAVEALWDQGIVVVVAAGNYGHSGNYTVMSPANSRKIITVGSLTDNGTGGDFSDDYVSTFSSRGPTLGDLVLKPDLIAPGNRLVAAIPKNSKLIGDLPGRVVECTAANCDDKYFELSGTSMAAPMVSAAAALMLEKDPTLSPATIKARLMRSARKIDAAPVDSGAGVLDVEAALNDTGVIPGEALSPLMHADHENNGVYIEDTALLWGDALWGTGQLWSDGFTWASGYGWTDGDGVNANGYVWTDGGGEVDANGYGWTDGVNANGYGWTDGGGTNANGYGWTDGGGGSNSQTIFYDASAENPVLMDDENTEQ